MPIPGANSPIQLTSLYPDRVQASFDFNCSQPLSFEDFRPVLRETHGFTKIRGRRAVRANLRLQALPQLIEVEVTKTRRDRPLRLKVSINPLSYLHHQRSDYAEEQGCNGDQNWLHPDDIHGDNTAVWSLTHHLLTNVAEELQALMAGVAWECEPRVTLQLANICINQLEIALDLAAPDPEGMTLRLGRKIQDECRASVMRSYRASATGYTRMDGDVRMIDGYRSRGARYKVYAKTNQRVRLECELSAEAIHDMGVRCDLAQFSGGFVEFFGRVAANALPLLRSIAEQRRGAPISALGPLNLLTDIARLARTPGVASEVVRTLIRRGHVTRDIGKRGLGARLYSANILERTSRNLYGIAPRYAEALRILRTQDEQWLDFLPEGEE